MAAHRKLWHKGLQRCALLTRKLGLGCTLCARSIEFKNFVDLFQGRKPRGEGILVSQFLRILRGSKEFLLKRVGIREIIAQSFTAHVPIDQLRFDESLGVRDVCLVTPLRDQLFDAPLRLGEVLRRFLTLVLLCHTGFSIWDQEPARLLHTGSSRLPHSSSWCRGFKLLSELLKPRAGRPLTLICRWSLEQFSARDILWEDHVFFHEL